MDITVVGTIVKDRIIAVDGTVTESFGGLFYSIEALRAISTPQDRITPVSFVGADLYDRVIAYFEKDARINLQGLYRIDQPNNHVDLHYTDAAERIEYSLDPLPPLTYEHIAPFLNAHLLLVNMISGWDIALSALQKAADAFHGILSMDVHSLTLGREPDGKRVRRKPSDFEEWLALPDIIQFNKQEFESLFHDGLTVFYKKYCFDRNKIVNLTLGNRGSISVYREKESIVKIETPPPPVRVVDPTGCGDVFLSAFAYAYYREKNIINGAKFANLVAATAGSRKGLPKAQWFRAELQKQQESE